MQKCYGCERWVPDTWSIPFTTRVRDGVIEGGVWATSLYGPFIPAFCPICCDRPLEPHEEVAAGGDGKLEVDEAFFDHAPTMGCSCGECS